MQTTITLSETIRLAIRRSGRTAQDIAAAMHVSARTVSNWQTGATTPKFDDVVRLAAITHQPLEMFAEAVAQEVRTLAGVCSGQVELDLTGDSPRVVVPPPFVPRRLLAA